MSDQEHMEMQEVAQEQVNVASEAEKSGADTVVDAAKDFFFNTPHYVHNGRFDFAYLALKVKECGQTAAATWYRPIEGNPVQVMAKKVIRKATSFYVGPAFEDQARWNQDATDALSQLTAFASEQAIYIRQLEKRIEKLENDK